MMDALPMIRDVLRDFRRSWPQLLLTDVLAKLVAFILLTPLLGLLLRLFVTAQAGGALTDVDILFFFLRPLGLAALISVVAASLGIAFAEQAGLMTIGLGAAKDRGVTYVDALHHVGRRSWGILKLAGHMVVRLLLILAPFVAAGGVVFWALLTDFDINYYLAEKPAEFWLAVAFVGLLGLVLIVVLARVISSWAFSLPLVLFRGTDGSEALQRSKAATLGHRGPIAVWLVGWLVLTILLSSLVAGVVGFVGHGLILATGGSIKVLAVAAGVVFLFTALGELAVSFVSGAFFALMVGRLWLARGGAEAEGSTLPVPSEPLGERPTRTIPRAGLLGGAVVGMIAAVVATMVLFSGIKTEDTTTITAHRGSSGAAPENTLAAVELAIAEGSDWVEIDVQETADGEVVVVHDSDFKKTSGIDLKIWDSTVEDLADIDIGSWFSPEFADQRVPTLRQVLQMCKGKAGVNIELKHYGHAERLEERVIEIVESEGMESDIVIMSLKHDSVRKIRELRPEWKAGLLSSVALGDLSKLDLHFLAVNSGLATRRFIRSANSRDREVYVWTINDPLAMSAMIDRGVDSLITDYPAHARSVLELRAELSTAEKLLLAIGGAIGLLDDEEKPSSEGDA